MAIAAVKATKGVATTGTSITLTALTATAGNALLTGGAGYVGGATGAWSVTRSGDTFTTDTEGGTDSPLTISSNWAGLASAPNVGAGGTDLVASCTNGNGIAVFAFEVSGLPTSGIRDAASPAIARGNSTAPASNNLTNVTANAIFIGVNADESGANPATETPGTGWTDTVGGTTMTNLNGSNSPVCAEEYKIVSSVAAQSATWTIDTNKWGAIIGVYKASGAAFDPATIADLLTQKSLPAWSRPKMVAY